MIAALGTAQANAPQSPACALLSIEEAAEALGGRPAVNDGGPAHAGSAVCGWTASEATLTLLLLQSGAIAGGDPTAYVEGLIAGARAAGEEPEALEGIGARAVLFRAAAGLQVLALVDGSVLTLWAVGVADGPAVAAARLAAGRVSL